MTGACLCGSVRYAVAEPLRGLVSCAAPWHPLPDDGAPRFDERLPPEVLH